MTKMAGETSVTVVGNLTAEPELRYTASGQAVANFTVASTPRTFKDGEWKDGDPLFIRCNVWRTMAENVAESLTKGARVVVQGKLKKRQFETREGGTRTGVDVKAGEVGRAWGTATAAVTGPGGGTGRGAPEGGGGETYGNDG